MPAREPLNACTSQPRISGYLARTHYLGPEGDGHPVALADITQCDNSSITTISDHRVCATCRWPIRRGHAVQNGQFWRCHSCAVVFLNRTGCRHRVACGWAANPGNLPAAGLPAAGSRPAATRRRSSGRWSPAPGRVGRTRGAASIGTTSAPHTGYSSDGQPGGGALNGAGRQSWAQEAALALSHHGDASWSRSRLTGSASPTNAPAPDRRWSCSMAVWGTGRCGGGSLKGSATTSRWWPGTPQGRWLIGSARVVRHGRLRRLPGRLYQAARPGATARGGVVVRWRLPWSSTAGTPPSRGRWSWPRPTPGGPARFLPRSSGSGCSRRWSWPTCRPRSLWGRCCRRCSPRPRHRRWLRRSGRTCWGSIRSASGRWRGRVPRTSAAS